MSPTIMVLTDSPHVPTTDSLTGNTCKITKNSRNGGRTGLQPATQGTDPSVSDARHYPILQIQPQNGKTILNFVPKRGFIILYHLE